MSNNLAELGFEYINVVIKISSALKANPIGIGSVFNDIESAKYLDGSKDIDFSLSPTGNPQSTQKKLEKFLEKLPRMQKRKHDTDIEAGRQYAAYDIYDGGRIALVISVDENDKPILGSIRLVNMEMKFPWTTKMNRRYTMHDVEGNPTKNSPIIEIGFPPYDENTKTWLDPRKYNPTQKYVGMLDGNKLTIEPCDHSGIESDFAKLTQKSQAILTLRLFAVTQQIPKGLNLKHFEEIAPQFYDFMYNVRPCINKMDISTLINALTNEEFMSRVIKHTFPYIYKVVMSFNRPPDYLASLFNSIKSRNPQLNAIKLISLAVQEEIKQQNPKSGSQIDIAANIGGVVERSIFDFEQNKLAYSEICKSDSKN